MRNLREKKSASRIFFESAQRQYRRRLEEDEILPPVEEVAVDVVEETPADDTIAERRARLRRSRLRRKLRASRRFEEDEVANDEVVSDVPAVVDTEETVAERRARLRRKLRNRKARRRFEEDEFVEVDEPVFLEDEVVNEDEETVTAPAVAERRARLRRRMRLARTKRFRDGFDTEQLGENIRNSVDFTVIKERLAKVKNRPNGVTKFRSGAVVSRANKLGKFSMKMRNGRTVQGIVKYRPNGSVKSFKISR